MKPTVCRIVLYRSQTADYTDAAAIVTATQETLVAGGGVPPLSGDTNVHLTVFTPEQPARPGRAPEGDLMRGDNVSGLYQVWDVPEATGHDPAPGTWRWPNRA